MTKVLYLLGAGASANAISPNQNLATNMINVSDELKNNTVYRIGGKFEIPQCGYSKSYEFIHSQVVDSLRYYGALAQKHQSVDTLAKKLLIKGDVSGYNRLKATLGIYFFIVQAAGSLDSRYDSFFASLIQSEGGISFPDDVAIISWNYDTQLEGSLKEFMPKSKMEDVREQLKIVESYDGRKIEGNEFFTYKVNGTASLVFDSSGKAMPFTEEWGTSINKEIAINILEFYAKNSIPEEARTKVKFNRTGLQYCWENIEEREAEFKRLKNRLNDVQTVVVIGYSFPFFNRSFDRLFFEDMEYLRDIYIQTLPESMADVRSSLTSVLERDKVEGPGKVNIHSVEASPGSQFFLPPDL